jgi:hypothetical protein
MSVPSQATVDALEREWWTRLPRVLYAPASVFAELRDESVEAADARQEPLTALVFLAGIAMFLGLFALEQPYERYRELSALVLTVEMIFGGAAVALTNFWLGGAVVYLGMRGLGAETGYRLGRHLAGLATAPFVFVLLVAVPFRLGLYGMDLFRNGGSDTGAGRDVFVAIDGIALAWTLVLVLIGIRQTQRWSWARSAGALGVGLLFAILIGTLAFAFNH